MPRWTVAQVEQHAPDAATRTAARRLARPGPWSEAGATELLVWGRCQGSGSTPYQVSVDLSGPAFRCSCPSRKFPCKHGLALLLLWAGGEDVAEVDAAAGFAADWQAERASRAAARAARTEATRARRARSDGAAAGGGATGGDDAAGVPAADPAAAARRREQRLARMTAGAHEAATWLEDLVAHGLAEARQRPASWWEATAARLVDAQLPGLASRVREAAVAVHARRDWADHLLAEAGRWYLATQAWARRESLGESELADLRAYLGWPLPTEEVRVRQATTGRWQVLGVHRAESGKLTEQRTWLAPVSDTGAGDTGASGAGAARRDVAGAGVVLDFAPPGGSLGTPHAVGTVLDGGVHSYPGSPPLRLLPGDDLDVAGMATSLPRATSVSEALAERAAVLARTPWPDRVPVSLGGLRPALSPGSVPPGSADGQPAAAGTRDGGEGPVGWLVDPAGDALPVVSGTDRWLGLLGRTGGRPFDLFGELEGEHVRPLTIAVDGQLVPL